MWVKWLICAIRRALVILTRTRFATRVTGVFVTRVTGKITKAYVTYDVIALQQY